MLCAISNFPYKIEQFLTEIRFCLTFFDYFGKDSIPGVDQIIKIFEYEQDKDGLKDIGLEYGS
jgi:hypothetical protein